MRAYHLICSISARLHVAPSDFHSHVSTGLCPFIPSSHLTKEGEKLERNLVGWTLIMTALSISLDELAVGFSIGLIDVPVALTILLIALQAFIFTFLGLAFGSKFKRFLGEWSEKVAGIVLGLLGFWIIIEAVLKLYK
ncbi:manganese efflux pump [Paenibacillus sp.]|uniref:manganese efflux pump MntP n=1 Tax=Paenibacillus sp. TaxID=58172 RepID=UPI0028A7590B|nr:manganese efflux pump [Paenibacillus sp.]